MEMERQVSPEVHRLLLKRVRQGNTALLATIPKVGRVMLVLSIGIVVCAVLAFH